MPLNKETKPNVFDSVGFIIWFNIPFITTILYFVKMLILKPEPFKKSTFLLMSSSKKKINVLIFN